MSFFLAGLVSAFLIVGLASLPAFIASSDRGRVAMSAGILFAVFAGINWFIYWIALPMQGFSWLMYSQTWLWWLIEFAVVMVALLMLNADDADRWTAPMVFGLIWVVFLLQGFFNLKAWLPGDGDALRSQAQVSIIDQAGEYPETDASHMVVVPVEVARQTAHTALGSHGDVSTFYNEGEPALQSIAGHAYWVSVLEPKGMWENSQKNGISPAFVVVDAEDPNVAARYVDKNADGTPLAIKYQPKGWFDNKLSRYAMSSGLADLDLDDWTLEVDDSWRPFYTASSNQLPSGAFTQTIPQETILVDAQTGEIQRYALDKTPDWIDRIYSANAVKAILNWWGEWGTAGFAPIYVSQGDRYKVSDGQEPTLVYTKSGHPEWQVQISTMSSGQAALYVALFSGRESSVKLYKVDNLLLESAASTIVLNSSQNVKKNQPTHIALHKIYGQLTWVMPLIDPAENDGDKDRSAFQGLALMKAQGANGSDLVMANSVQGALADYRNNVLKTGDTKPEEDSTLQTVTGVVSHLSPPMVEGSVNVFYFRLQGANRTYKMSVDPNDSEQSTERPFIKVGAKITLTYRDSGDNKGDVVKYDDLGIS
jgi:hypothetical protein